MHNQKFWSVLTISTIIFMLVSGASAATEKILYNFTGATGERPFGNLVFDSSGNLYGTTALGGDKACSCGTVFELTPAKGGGWTQTVIHSFDGKDGADPFAGVVFDAKGNLYGTTQVGGLHDRGVIFELMPNAGGGWSEKVLHSFTGGYDGAYPSAGLIIDSAGNLYGTAQRGGRYGFGVAFEFTPTSTGWRHNILHSFGLNGKFPIGGLVLDPDGNLYGTTTSGGNRKGAGLVFELTPNSSGPWNEIVLYEFQGNRHGSKDGSDPMATLTFDKQGNLYGTTFLGGPHHGRGVIFKLTPSTGGPWTETILHYAGHKGGYRYHSGLIFDASGNLYGTAASGGGNEAGTVFRLTPTSSGFWKEQVLYSFANNGLDGAVPLGSLIFDAKGNLYGTTEFGGATSDDGTVFEVMP